MSPLLAIGIGGAVGAVMRYLLSGWVYGVVGRGFPWGTLAVNVVGSLAMGLLYVLLLERAMLGPEWRAGLQVGLLGALTTFSTFSIETLMLVEEGEPFKAVVNVVASVVLCVAATWIGVNLGRQL